MFSILSSLSILNRNHLHASLGRGIMIKRTRFQGKVRVKFSREMTPRVAGRSQRTFTLLRCTCSIVRSLICPSTSIGSGITILCWSTGSRGLSSSSGWSSTFDGWFARASFTLSCSQQIIRVSAICEYVHVQLLLYLTTVLSSRIKKTQIKQI